MSDVDKTDPDLEPVEAVYDALDAGAPAEALELTREGWAREYGAPPSLFQVAEWQSVVARWPRLPRAFLLRPETLGRWPAMESWARFSGILYRSLARVTGAEVLVDSSKWIGNPGPLGLIPGIEGRVLHLVRDPRAVAFSWQRQKEWLPGEKAMPRFGPIHTSLSWNARNLLAGYVTGRSGEAGLRVRYEDFTAWPGEVLAKVFESLAVSPSLTPLQGERTLQLEENHTAMGNASRFRTGKVELTPDTEWQRGQKAATRRLITGLTFPLLHRYGYPSSPGSSG